jgi:hypothetical protein
MGYAVFERVQVVVLPFHSLRDLAVFQRESRQKQPRSVQQWGEWDKFQVNRVAADAQDSEEAVRIGWILHFDYQ